MVPLLGGRELFVGCSRDDPMLSGCSFRVIEAWRLGAAALDLAGQKWYFPEMGRISASTFVGPSETSSDITTMIMHRNRGTGLGSWILERI